MNKNTIIRLFLISMILLLSNLVLAETAEIKDTSIDYVGYREVVVNEPGVVYQIKITNTGTREKEYELVPGTEIIKNIGTYRINPSDKITLQPGEQETVYFYIAVEKKLQSRTIIPMEIRSGLASAQLDLVLRTIGPLEEEQKSNTLAKAFKTVIIIIIILIIILALIVSFRKKRKQEELEDETEPEFDEDIATYY